MKRHTLFTVLIVLLSTCSTSFADLSPTAFSFSSLLSKADAVVSGKVTSVATATREAYLINFNVEKGLLGSGLLGTIQIFVPLKNGSPDPDEAYLKKDDRHIIAFLRKSNTGQWTVVNKHAGIIAENSSDDIRRLLNMYATYGNLSSRGALVDVQRLFWMIESPQLRSRLLQDLAGKLTEDDAQFLISLLTSSDEHHQAYAAVQVGRDKIASLRPQVEALLANSPSNLVKFHCLVGLGELGNTDSRNLVLSFVNDPDTWLRKASFHAAGLIGGSEIMQPLVQRYAQEENMGNRLTIVESLERLPDTTAVIATLRDFESSEGDPLLKQIISNTVSRLCHE